MNMPGFTAENSLYDMHAPYQTAGAIKVARGIRPAQFGDIGFGNVGFGNVGFGDSSDGEEFPTGTPENCMNCTNICAALCQGRRNPPRCFARCKRKSCALDCNT
jgi:hypothetical protein